MLVQFGNNWIQKIPLTAKSDSACGLVQFWLSSEFFSSNYFQIGQACSPITYTNWKNTVPNYFYTPTRETCKNTVSETRQ